MLHFLFKIEIFLHRNTFAVNLSPVVNVFDCTLHQFCVVFCTALIQLKHKGAGKSCVGIALRL